MSAQNSICQPPILVEVGNREPVVALHMENSHLGEKDQGVMAISEIILRDSRAGHTLPPLHQAIPEYLTRNPRDQRNVKGGLSEILCPSPLGPSRMSPPTHIAPTPSPKRRRFQASQMSFLASRGAMHAAGSTPASQLPPLHVSAGYERSSSGPSPTSDRLQNGISRSSSVSFIETPRDSPGLPPISTFTSTQTSPLESHFERPSKHYALAHLDYRVSSPGFGPVSSPYHHASPLPQRPTPYSNRPSAPLDRSPFCSSGSHHPAPLEMGVDYYEPSRGSKRRRGNLPKPVTDLLRSWLTDHLTHPYPTEEEKQMLMLQTGLSISQISNWFINARRRRVPVITKSARAESEAKLARQGLQRAC